MKTVYPTAYTFQQEKGLPYFHVGNEDKVEYQLTVDIRLSNVEGNESSVSNSRDITSSVLVARRKIFRQGLVDTVKHHHQVLFTCLYVVHFLKDQVFRISSYLKESMSRPRKSDGGIPNLI